MVSVESCLHSVPLTACSFFSVATIWFFPSTVTDMHIAWSLCLKFKDDFCKERLLRPREDSGEKHERAFCAQGTPCGSMWLVGLWGVLQ